MLSGAKHLICFDFTRPPIRVNGEILRPRPRRGLRMTVEGVSVACSSQPRLQTGCELKGRQANG